MSIFKSIFGIMIKRLLNKRNIFFFIVIALLLIFLVNEGKNRYLDVVQNKQAFQQMEENKVKNYVYYDQYAGFGIKILFIPSPFIALRSDSIVDEIRANINIGERLNISMPLGKNFSFDNPGFLDFFGIFLILAVTCGFIAGFEITDKDDYAKLLYLKNNSITQFLKPVFSTITLLTAAFLALMLAPLIWLLLHGINLFTGHILILLLGIILVTVFSVSLGTVAGNLKINESNKWVVLIMIIIAGIMFLPWLSQKINEVLAPNIESTSNIENKNFIILMESEQKGLKEIGSFKNDGNRAPEKVLKIIEGYRKKYFGKITENEDSQKQKIMKRIKNRQTLLSFFPVTFVLSLNKEISSLGDESYIEFYSISRELKKEFRNFIFFKKFYEGAKPGKVEPFKINGEDKNIYYARSHLPHNFWLGVFLSLLYTSVLLFISFRKQANRLKNPGTRGIYNLTFNEGNEQFIHCETGAIKTDIFNYYQQQEGVACIGKVNAEDFQFYGVKPAELLDHLCILSGVELQKAVDNLRSMGIKDIDAFKENSRSLTLKIIVAVKTAADCDRVVLDDFFLDETREFERSVINFLVTLSKAGKKIIYLSIQPFQMATTLDDGIDVNGVLILPMDLADLSFR